MENDAAVWKPAWRLLTELRPELSCDPMMPLLSTYTNDSNHDLDEVSARPRSPQHCSQRKMWKPPESPEADEWIKKLYRHTDTQTPEYHSAF